MNNFVKVFLRLKKFDKYVFNLCTKISAFIGRYVIRLKDYERK